MGDETSEVEKEIQTLQISGEDEPITSLDQLPRNVIVNILSMLDLDDFGAIFFVNKKLNQIAKDDYLWQAIYQTTNWTIPLSMNDNVIFTEFLNQKSKEEIAKLLKNEDSDIIGQDTLNFIDSANVWYSFFTLRFTVELEMGASTEVYEVEEIEEIEEERDEEAYDDDDDEYRSHEEYYSESENDSENDQQVSQLEKHLEGASQDLENVQIFDLISERFPEFSFHFSRMDQFLISFFSNHKIITDLINLLLQKNVYAPEKINQSQKIENFILQILANENICAIYIEDEKYNLLNHLFSFLEKDKQFEKNDKFFSFFVIIVENIFKYFPSDFINFMKTNNTILPNLINSVSENPKFSELLIKFTENSLSHPWLLSSNFFPNLLQYLIGLNDPDEEEETCDVIMEILHGCLQWPESDLITDLFNNPTVADALISFILSSSSTPGTFPLIREDRIVNGIKIYLGMSSLISDAIVDMPLLIQQMLIPSTLQFLTDVLNKDKTKYFGHTRLSVIELFSGLLITGYSTVFEIFKNEKIFDLLFNLFFEYPWNNILHHHLLQVFCCLTFAGNNDENFVSSVLETSGLIDKIVDTFAKETPHTVGYLSYLQRISNDLIDHAQHSTPLCTLLENNERWLEFMNSLENLNSLEVQQSQQEDTYEGEYDEDLDGYEGEEVCQVEEYQVIEEEENEEDNEEH